MSEPINHYHECSCGTEWGHELESPDYEAAHACPCCGAEVRLVSRWENDHEKAIWQARAMEVQLNNFIFNLAMAQLGRKRA